MTIAYPDGTAIEAIVLSHEENEIRAIAGGCDDVLAFNCIYGTWFSEENEPVVIEFAWQRRRASTATSEEDCICPKELAARLLRALFRGGNGEEPEAVVADTFDVFSAQGSHIANHRSELKLMRSCAGRTARVN